MNESVSVVIPSFNRASTLRRAIDSCRTQSHPLNEIIVVDDGSTDGTPGLLAELSSRETRLIVLRLPINGGAQAARIEGIKACSSEWVAFLDSDDEFTADSVEKRLAAARSCGFEPGLVCGDFEHARTGKAAQLPRISGDVFPRLCVLVSFTSYCTIMVRRRCFETAGYPSADFPAMQDEDMALTVSREYPVLHCGAVVVRVHETPGQISGSWRAKSSGCFRLVAKYQKDILKHRGPAGLLISVLRATHLSLGYWLQSENARIHPLGRLGPWFLSGILRRVLAPYYRERGGARGSV